MSKKYEMKYWASPYTQQEKFNLPKYIYLTSQGTECKLQPRFCNDYINKSTLSIAQVSTFTAKYAGGTEQVKGGVHPLHTNGLTSDDEES